tara:strand:+ start:6005 stop:6535 length:531 start_codon:yes stop_codon:yes gene_type:complete
MFKPFPGTSDTNYSNKVYNNNQLNNHKTGGSAVMLDRIMDNINIFKLESVNINWISEDLDKIFNFIIKQIEENIKLAAAGDIATYKNTFNRSIKTMLNKDCIKNTMANRKALSQLGSMYCEYPFFVHLRDKYFLPHNIKKIQESADQIYVFSQVELALYAFIAIIAFIITIKLFLK